MQDNNIETPRQAGVRVAQMYAHGKTPTAEQELAALQHLATANLYKASRDMLSRSRGLDPVGAAHVIGYILGASGVTYEAATLIEGIVRNAVSDAQAQRGDR
ncbi:hypothetical protein [Nocardioides lijunqiniae]|uniref:hypothetical protein n=1 Tax=Nocardioides lijunqiniae TaxID=2760832 RepID=UPI001877ECC1|nr:hypothetical protein [Nocardioides lijunqiniae]